MSDQNEPTQGGVLPSVPLQPIVQCCKSCGLWDRVSAQDKAGRVRKDSFALCLWKMKDPLPESIRDWGKPLYLKGGFMPATCGTKCACWVPRTLNTAGQETPHGEEGKA